MKENESNALLITNSKIPSTNMLLKIHEYKSRSYD